VPAVATNATANGYHDRWKKMLRNTRFRVLSSLASQKARCAKMLAGKNSEIFT
jgi:hypothetical protein